MTGFDMDASVDSCSEQQLQRELDLARRAGGGRNPACCRTEAAATVDRLGEDVGARLSEVRVVGQVEHLGAELKRRGPLKRDVFQEREVDGREFGTRQTVSAHRAESPRR